MSIEQKFLELQNKISEVEKKYDFLLEILRSQLVQVKNKDFLSDDTILRHNPYVDLDPKHAYDFYSNDDKIFYLLDVSGHYFEVPSIIEETNHIPYESLHENLDKLPSRNTPILVMSENGTKSIQACSLLNKHGYFMLYNVSGGHKFWPGHIDENQGSVLKIA